ncbi:pyridoxamine 5'-phosphate oxidase family protein [Fusibacter sp. 3D3]|uniref:pyridoxamine 5'-phosphate oxidase family protein n=1 Tax=Fusibacter sp. 3D3 TaxID=1048380 RepID=UPI000852F1EB|nr:pyridoxamine 5'-phosphate oxidase family protein [Fusibacter sp. 3D3]GAU78152.1 putative general stress protein [Fusibacter sp. 3D3]
MYKDIFKKASDMVNHCEVGYFSVLDVNGYPSVATRSNVKSNGITEIFFSTGTSGDMASSVMRNSKTAVCFRNEGDNISLIGQSEVVTDMGIKKSLWVDWFIDHFPGGVEDPEYCVVRFTTERVSMWVDRKVYKFDMDEITGIAGTAK